MNRVTLHLIGIAILLCGCVQNRSVIEITCKPHFESKPLPELIVTGPDGDRVDAFDLILVLLHGGKQYRIPWGTEPVSPGPVALSVHQTYTFKLDTTQTVMLSIHEGNKLIYEGPSPASNKRDAPDD